MKKMSELREKSKTLEKTATQSQEPLQTQTTLPPAVEKTTPFQKISLLSEGILLQCTVPFNGKPKRLVQPNNTGNAAVSPRWSLPEIKQNDVVMFLGCWHYKMQIGHTPSATIMEREFKSPTWVTSLQFLNDQTIVKIDWIGINKLDQLLEAARFLYNHFCLIDR